MTITPCLKCNIPLKPYFLKDGLCNGCCNPESVVTRVLSLEPKYYFGTRFKKRHKVPRYCIVVDILKTYNYAGELAFFRYVATHEFMGQTVTDKDVVETTIDMGVMTDCFDCGVLVSGTDSGIHYCDNCY